MGFGEILFKTTGLMTKNVRFRRCAELGEYLTQKVIGNGTKATAEDVSMFLNKTINTKKMKRITISSDKNKLKQFMVEDMKMDTGYVEQEVERRIASSVSTSNVTGKTLVDLRIDNMDTTLTINTCVHETQHLFKRICSCDFFEQLWIRLRGKNYAENFAKKYSTVASKANLDIQQQLFGLLDYKALDASSDFAGGKSLDIILNKTGCINIQELHELIRKIIRQNILLPNCDKRNYKVLKIINAALKDESNSYKVGGLAEKSFYKTLGVEFSGDTKSEALSKLYEEASSVVKEEAHKQKINNIKRFLGLKIKDYKPKPESRFASTEELLHFVENGIMPREDFINMLSNRELEKYLENGIITKEEFVKAMNI